MPQLIVVIEVLVAEGESHHPLGEQFVNGELDPLRIAKVGETPRELPDDAAVLLDLTEQPGPGAGGDATAIECGGKFPPSLSLEQQPLRATLRHDETCCCVCCDLQTHNILRQPDGLVSFNQ